MWCTARISQVCRIFRASSKEWVKPRLAGERALYCQRSRGGEERGLERAEMAIDQRSPRSSFQAARPTLSQHSALLGYPNSGTPPSAPAPYSTLRIAPSVFPVLLRVVTVCCVKAASKLRPQAVQALLSQAPSELDLDRIIADAP